MMMSARSIDIHSPVSDLPGRKEGSRASGDSGEEENTHEVVRAEGLFSWSEEDEQPERDEESVRERCGRSPRRSRTTGRDADTTTQGGIIFNLTEEDEHVVEETPESHVGPLREGGSGQQRRTRTAARGSSGACTWTRTKPCGAKTQIDSEEHAADGVGDVPVPSHTTSGQEENKQSGPSSSTCDEDDVGPQMSGECWCPEDESFWDRPQGEWPYDPERQEEGEREQGSDGGGGGIRVRRIEFCRDTASIDDIRLMLVKSNAEAHVVQKVVYNLKARDSIIAQVMKQLSSLLAQSIEMHWQRQELLLRQQELEKEGRCCTTEESADSEVQDPRQKEAAFEGLDHSAFLSEPVFTKRKEEALFVSSSVASANGPQLEPPRDRSVLDSTPACTLTEKPVVEADSGSREHQKTEGGDAASKTPPPTSSPISCAKASDPVHSEAAPASSVAVPAVDCNLPCEDKVEEERAEACSGQSRFAEDSNTFEPQTQPAAMRISPAEWERVLQTHRVKVEELTSMMHRVERAFFPGPSMAEPKTLGEPEIRAGSAAIKEKSVTVSPASSADTAELVRLLRAACASHTAALNQLVIVADKIRVKTRGCRAGRNKHRVRAPTDVRLTASVGGVLSGGAGTSPPTTGRSLQSVVRSPDTVNPPTPPSNAASRMTQPPPPAWTGSRPFGPRPSQGLYVSLAGSTPVPPPPPFHDCPVAERGKAGGVTQSSRLAPEYAHLQETTHAASHGLPKRDGEERCTGRTAAVDDAREASATLAPSLGEAQGTNDNPRSGERQDTEPEGEERLKTLPQRSEPAAFLRDVLNFNKQAMRLSCGVPNSPGAGAPLPPRPESGRQHRGCPRRSPRFPLQTCRLAPLSFSHSEGQPYLQHTGLENKYSVSACSAAVPPVPATSVPPPPPPSLPVRMPGLASFSAGGSVRPFQPTLFPSFARNISLAPVPFFPRIGQQGAGVAAVSAFPCGAHPTLSVVRGQGGPALMNQQHSPVPRVLLTQQHPQQRCSLARTALPRPAAPPPPPETTRASLGALASRSSGGSPFSENSGRSSLAENTGGCILPRGGAAGGCLSTRTEITGFAAVEGRKLGAPHHVMPLQTPAHIHPRSPTMSAQVSQQTSGLAATSEHENSSAPASFPEKKVGRATVHSFPATLPSNGQAPTGLTLGHAPHLPLHCPEAEPMETKGNGGAAEEVARGHGHSVPRIPATAAVPPAAGKTGLALLCPPDSASSPLQGGPAGGGDRAAGCLGPVNALNITDPQRQQYLMVLQSPTQDSAGLLAGNDNATLAAESVRRQHVLLLPHGHPRHPVERRSRAPTPHSQARLAVQHLSSPQLGVCPPHQQLLLPPPQQEAGAASSASASTPPSLVSSTARGSAYALGAQRPALAVLPATVEEARHQGLEITDGCDRSRGGFSGYPVSHLSAASRINNLSVAHVEHPAHLTGSVGFPGILSPDSQFKSAPPSGAAENSRQNTLEPSSAEARYGPENPGGIVSSPRRRRSVVASGLGPTVVRDAKHVDAHSWSEIPQASDEAPRVDAQRCRAYTADVHLSETDRQDKRLPEARGSERQRRGQRHLDTKTLQESGVLRCSAPGVPRTTSATCGPEIEPVETSVQKACQENSKGRGRDRTGGETGVDGVGEGTVVTRGGEKDRPKGVLESEGQDVGRRRLASEGDVTASSRERLYAQLRSPRS